LGSGCPKFFFYILIEKLFIIYGLRMIFANMIIFTRMFIGFRENDGGWGAASNTHFYGDSGWEVRQLKSANSQLLVRKEFWQSSIHRLL
jgi:hypothetical protein